MCVPLFLSCFSCRSFSLPATQIHTQTHTRAQAIISARSMFWEWAEWQEWIVRELNCMNRFPVCLSVCSLKRLRLPTRNITYLILVAHSSSFSSSFFYCMFLSLFGVAVWVLLLVPCRIGLFLLHRIRMFCSCFLPRKIANEEIRNRNTERKTEYNVRQLL